MLDFEKICRTCSSEGELQSLFITDPIIIADMLYQITNLKVNKDDNFPQNICTYCVDQLKTAYYFTQQCYDVNTRLVDSLNTQNNSKLEENSNEEFYEEFNSSANFEFYIDNTDSLEADNLNTENEIKLIKCETCLKLLRPDSLSRHLKRHTTKRPYECSKCSKNFISKIELKTHLRKHTDFKPFECNHCEKSFKQRRSLLHHMNVTHLDIIKEKFPLKKRLNVHRTVECNICLKPIGSNNLIRHLQTHNRIRPFGCSSCGKSFTQKVQLQIHMRIHTGEAPFKCNHCENSFKQRGSLLYHIKVHHMEEIEPSPIGEFECNICKEKFTTKIILASHKLLHAKGTRKINVRSTTKPYLCNYCGVSFLTVSHLQDHIGTHTGEKRHKCDVCGKSFAAYSVYDVHRRRHLNVKPYKCNLCVKTFVTKKELQRHELIHTDEKPFTCEICYQSYRQRSHLKYHSYTHTGEKQITCPECDKGFYGVHSMNRHKKIHFKHLILNNTENEHAYA